MISGSILETSATLKSLRLNMRNERGNGETESKKETFTPLLCVCVSVSVWMHVRFCVSVCVCFEFFFSFNSSLLNSRRTSATFFFFPQTTVTHFTSACHKCFKNASLLFCFFFYYCISLYLHVASTSAALNDTVQEKKVKQEQGIGLIMTWSWGSISTSGWILYILHIISTTISKGQPSVFVFS